MDILPKKNTENKCVNKCSIPLVIQFSSVAQSNPTLCAPINCSTPGLPVHREVQIKIAMKYHYISTKMDNIKRTNNNKC